MSKNNWIVRNSKLLLLTFCGLAPFSFGQAPTNMAGPRSPKVAARTQAPPMPEAHVYHHLFQYILHLESLHPGAAENPFLDDLAKRQLGLDPSEFSVLQNEAHACESEVAAVDNQAHDLIQSIRNQYPGGRVASKDQIPKPPEALVRLQQQRDAIIEGHVNALQTSMGQTSFAKLETNVQKHFAPAVHAQALRRTPQTNPAQNKSLPPLNH